MSVNRLSDFRSGESDNQKKPWSLWHKLKVLAAIKVKNASVNIATIV